MKSKLFTQSANWDTIKYFLDFSCQIFSYDFAKMKTLIIGASLAVGSVMAGTSWAAPMNIALNAPVTAVSGSSSISNPSTSLSVVTDGIFTPEDTGYSSATAQSEAVEWSGATSGGAPATGLLLQINLGGNFTITGAIVQADDNDSYLLQYLDETSSTWKTLYDVPEVSVGFGLRTRPNADQTTYQSVGPVVTDAVRFSAVAGDGGYAVSEIELQGTAVPEPSTYGLLLVGSVAGWLVKRRRVIV
jgi:PEP-CTERM motif